MAETQPIFISDGYWYSYYEPLDMKGVFLRTRYKLSPSDGGGMPKDGRHLGIIIGNNSFSDEGRLLRLVAGGELAGSATINQELRDFSFKFDEQYHDDYKAGATRGFKGKRACSHDFYYRQRDTWRFGYDEGRRARLDAIKSNTIQKEEMVSLC